MELEELLDVEVSGLCLNMSGEELVKAIMLQSKWSPLTKQKPNREKLTDFTMQSLRMDSRLLQLLFLRKLLRVLMESNYSKLPSIP